MEFYIDWYNQYNRLPKIFLPTPQEFFSWDIIMTLLNIYLKSKTTYLIFNVLCSDEMI